MKCTCFHIVALHLHISTEKKATRKLAGANFKKLFSSRRDTAAGPRFIEKKRGRAESKEREDRQLTVDIRQTGSPTPKGEPP